MLKFALIAVSTVLAGVLLAAPAAADPVIYPPSYGSNGVYVVGGHARDGYTASIPPGHYRADGAPGIWKAPGFWLRCNDTPCTPTNPGHIIGNGDSGNGALMEILPTDTAVYLFNTTLTFLGGGPSS